MRGVDIGTCFLVSSIQDSNGQIKLKSVRDAFIDFENDPSVRNMLNLNKTDFIEAGDKLYIIGDPALVLANIFCREARRPLAKGVIAPGELEAERVLMVLIESILGKSQAPAGTEVCFYSVPGVSIDTEMDIIYHSAIFSRLVSQLGYKPVSMNEAAAIGYANTAQEQFSGLSISAGAGMLNICLMYQTMIGMSFSISRGGDWIDQSAARATGSTASRIQMIKEKGIDLLDPSKGDPKTLREREAIIVYYKSLILYALDSIKKEFMKRQGTIDLPKSIPIILSGGTALAGNFLEFFRSAFDTVKGTWPIPISEIRMATDPLGAVSQGLLVAAMNYDEGKKK